VASANDGTLLARAKGEPVSMARDELEVDPTSQMGTFSRWMNGYGARREEPDGTTFFDERTGEDEKALTYTTAPLSEDLVIVGYPTIHLWVSSSHPDGDFFAYLEEIDVTGQAHYVSEGALRASHRALAEPPFENFGLPYHRSFPDDLADLPPGEPVELTFDLMGTAIVIDSGHRIRITITGADARNHELYPDPSGQDLPTISIHRGGEYASYVELPVQRR
jgi:putative CocE/NonD family hydrolase